ncbi:segregation and condensation protein A [Oceanotoga teriensis]|uniref:Segregation and condensation protein A n=1 Tax=Oceanotoga teriensis TaxID=515440 RepID=A0AA45HJM3_9BACT|nr:hypothetical protein [Oceanotoga teriensis]PWJ96254.1 segregation and condensation protein A [Oceanotoga teriensis]
MIIEELNIEIDIYSGSFSTLVELVKDKKIPLNEISVSEISDLYLNFIQKNKNKLSEIGEFMKLSAYLTYLKSLSLLPDKNNKNRLRKHTEQLYSTIDDYELLDYTKKILMKEYGKPSAKYVRVKPRDKIDQKDAKIQLENFVNDYLKVQEKLEIIKEVYSVEEAIKRLEKENQLNIYDIYKISDFNKLKFIVLFLGILTLIRNDRFSYEDGIFINLK